MSKALVLLSGGQDSTTCLAIAKQAHPEGVEAVVFDYGQRHKIELIQAKKIADLTETPLQQVGLPFISTLTANALTRDDIKIDHIDGELPTTFVPGRNLFFLSVAAVIAQQKGLSVIYTGVCQTDFSGYPDCRDDFVKSANQTINLAMETKLEIKTPLMWLDKAETIQLMKKIGCLSWYKETHTCYEGKRPACSECPACKLRLAGFGRAGVSDPLCYL